MWDCRFYFMQYELGGWCVLVKVRVRLMDDAENVPVNNKGGEYKGFCCVWDGE